MSKFKMVKFPKIPSFENLVKDLQRQKEFSPDSVPDKITFYPTVKLHGTNAGIAYVISNGELRVQSRNQHSPVNGHGHFGFNKFVQDNEENLRDYFEYLSQPETYATYIPESEQEKPDVVVIFGEWCGPEVQKGVGISKIPEKAFFVFDISYRVPNCFGNPQVYSYTPFYEKPDVERYHTLRNITVSKPIVLDMNNPYSIKDYLDKETEKVVECCPVASRFGVKGFGEGIVWRASIRKDGYTQYIRFKTKGEHFNTHVVKSKVKIDPNELSTIISFCKEALTDRRIEQGVEFLVEKELPLQKNSTKEFIGFILKDVFDECSDVIEELGIDNSNLKKELSKQSAKMFFSKLLEMNQK